MKDWDERLINPIMAASRSRYLLRCSFRMLINSHLPINRISASPLNKNTYRTFSATERRFYCESSGLDEAEQTASPRNLLEVYKSDPSLLDGPRDTLKPLTEEYVEKEIKKSRRVRLRRPVKIDPSKVGWTTGSKRVGTVGVKLGMSALWLKDGRRVPVTLIQVTTTMI